MTNDEYESVGFYTQNGPTLQNGFSRFEKNGKYYFCCFVEGEVSLISQAYSSQSGRDNGIESVKKNSKLAERYRVNESADGGSHYSLLAGNRQEIAISPRFNTSADAQHGSEAMQRFARGRISSKPTTERKSVKSNPVKPVRREDNYRPLAFYQNHIDPSVDGFTTFQGEDNKHYFTYNVGGRIELISEGYGSENAMLKGVDSVINNMGSEDRYEFRQYKSGKRDYRLRARNGKEIARSIWYDSREGARAGAKSVSSFFDGKAGASKPAATPSSSDSTASSRRVRRYYNNAQARSVPLDVYYVPKETPTKRPIATEPKTRERRLSKPKTHKNKAKPSPVKAKKSEMPKSRTAKLAGPKTGTGRRAKSGSLSPNGKRTKNVEQDYQNDDFYKLRAESAGDGFYDFTSDDGMHYFTYNQNGKTCLISEAYPQKAARDRGRESTAKNMVIEKRIAYLGPLDDGSYRYIVKAGNHKEVARSVAFGSAGAASSAAALAWTTAKKKSKPKTSKPKTRKPKAVETKQASIGKKAIRVKSKSLAAHIDKPKVKRVIAKTAKPKTGTAKKAVTTKKTKLAVKSAALASTAIGAKAAAKANLKPKPKAKPKVSLKKVKAKALAAPTVKPRVKRVKTTIATTALGVAAGGAAMTKKPVGVKPVETLKKDVEPAKVVRPMAPVSTRPATVTPPPVTKPIPPAPIQPAIAAPAPMSAPAPMAAVTKTIEAAPIAAAAATTTGAASAAASSGFTFRWIWLLLPLLLLLGLFGLKQCNTASDPLPGAIIADSAPTIEAEAPKAIKPDPVIEEPLTEPSIKEVVPEAVIESAPEPVKKAFIEPKPIEAEPVKAEPIPAEPTTSDASLAVATEICGSSTNPIFNVDTNYTPKNVVRLGTFPEFGDSHGLTPEGFYNKLAGRAASNNFDRQYLDHVFRSIGYSGGFADARPDMFSEAVLERGAKGVLGYGDFHGIGYSQLNVKSDRDLKAFRIQAASGPDIFYMKTCGNYMYVCR